jgi:hypothetical protein
MSNLIYLEMFSGITRWPSHSVSVFSIQATRMYNVPGMATVYGDFLTGLSYFLHPKTMHHLKCIKI